jgi:hypothetical protein
MTSRRWEYKLLSTKDLPSAGMMGLKPRARADVEAYLNELGKDGWEIIGIGFNEMMDSDTHFQALAKRER